MPLQLYTFSFQAMGAANQIQFFGSDPIMAQAISEHVISDIRSVEKKFSRYLPDSIISQVNSSAGDSACKVDEETAALLDYAQTCYHSSDGLFDITSGVLRKVWNFKQETVPSSAQLEEVLPLIGWDKVDWRKPYLFLTKKGMEIDFGGIGKEYAVDRAAGVLQQSGIQSGLVNLGGDVRVIGKQPDGRPWRIGITHPRKSGTAIASLLVSSSAVATSGDYERFFELDGRRYCHILNPKSGLCAEGFQSVTVLSESCLVAGSATTIAILKGVKEGLTFLEDLGVPYVVVDGKGQVLSGNSAKIDIKP